MRNFIFLGNTVQSLRLNNVEVDRMDFNGTTVYQKSLPVPPNPNITIRRTPIGSLGGTFGYTYHARAGEALEIPNVRLEIRSGYQNFPVSTHTIQLKSGVEFVVTLTSWSVSWPTIHHLIHSGFNGTVILST